MPARPQMSTLQGLLWGNAKAVIAITGSLFFLVFSIDFLLDTNLLRTYLPYILALIAPLAAIAGALNYLEPRERIQDPVNFDQILVLFRREIDEIRQMATQGVSLTAADHDEIMSRLADRMPAEMEMNIRRSIEENLRESPPESPHVSTIRSLSSEMQRRLLNEIAALGRRANLNLVIGVAISLVALAALYYFVFVTSREISTQLDPTLIALRFGIRLSLVIFMQVFAYFFLRLYRYSLFEIKYFQNELTGSQFRVMALETGLMLNDKAILDKLCATMSKIERNTILRKGETSLAMQRDQIEADYDKSLFALLDRVTKKAADPA